MSKNIRNGCFVMPVRPLLTVDGLLKDLTSPDGVIAKLELNKTGKVNYAFSSVSYIKWITNWDLDGDINNVTPNCNNNFFHLVCNESSQFTEVEACMVAEVLLKKYKWNVNCTNDHGHTPLYLAANENRYNLVNFLCEFGADINHQTVDGRTALHKAAFLDAEESVNVLLGRGVDSAIKDKHGYTALQLAQKYKDEKMIEILKTYDQAPRDVKSFGVVIGADCNKNMQAIVTPKKRNSNKKGLFSNMNKVVLKNILDFLKPKYEASFVDFEDRYEPSNFLTLSPNPPLHEPSNVLTLSPNPPLHEPRNVLTLSPNPPLHEPRNVLTLSPNPPLHEPSNVLTLSPNPPLHEPRNVLTLSPNPPLHEPRNVLIFDGLVQALGHVAEEQAGAQFLTEAPIGNLSVKEYMEWIVSDDLKGNIIAKKSNDTDFLHLLCVSTVFSEEQTMAIATILIDKYNWNVNTKNIHGHTPLFLSAGDKRPGLVELLIRYGADVNHQIADGRTALHKAALLDRDENVEILLKRGVDSTIKNKEGYTALEVAKHCKDREPYDTVALILERHEQAQRDVKSFGVTIGVNCNNNMQTIVTPKIPKSKKNGLFMLNKVILKNILCFLKPSQ